MDSDEQTVEQIIARLTQGVSTLDHPPQDPETLESIINSAIERARSLASEGGNIGNAAASPTKTR